MFNELRITVIAPFGFETIEHTHQPKPIVELFARHLLSVLRTRPINKVQHESGSLKNRSELKTSKLMIVMDRGEKDAYEIHLT